MKPVRPKKRLGQNFLRDRNTAQRIVDALPLTAPNLIIEIGPGTGAITGGLVERADAYIGIELDPALAENLHQTYGHHPQFSIILQDFLKADLAALISDYPGHHLSIIGNIPYNITSPILFKLMDFADHIDHAIIMMQREVAQRLVASPGNRAYGLLAINAQLFCETEYLFTVNAGQFYPKPKVDSAVVRLRFKSGVKAGFRDFDFFRTVIRQAFQQRRKMLRNSLSGLVAPENMTKLPVVLTDRPERLSIEEWISLTDAILAINKGESL